MTPVSSHNSRITAWRGSSSASMPPCGICHSSPGRMISGPSSLKRRPISTWPSALNSATPTLRRYGFSPAVTALTARQPGKLLHDALIDRTFERHDQLRQIAHRLPAPADELGLMAVRRLNHVDFLVVAGEPHGEPLLPLGTIAALPGAAGHGAWNVVDQPFRDFAELLHRLHAGLFIELALGGFPGILAGIDAALRHLPDMGFVDMLDAAGAAADEHQPLRVEQHHPDAGSIGQIVV